MGGGGGRFIGNHLYSDVMNIIVMVFVGKSRKDNYLPIHQPYNDAHQTQGCLHPPSSMPFEWPPQNFFRSPSLHQHSSSMNRSVKNEKMVSCDVVDKKEDETNWPIISTIRNNHILPIINIHGFNKIYIQTRVCL